MQKIRKYQIILLFVIFAVFGSCNSVEKLTSREKKICGILEKKYELTNIHHLTQYIDSLSNYKLNQQHYCTTIITNVNVVDALNDTVLMNHCVIYHENIIAEVLPVTNKFPRNYKSKCIQYIDGGGNYLAPGLCNMHVHYQCQRDRLYAMLFGITTVRNVSGQQMHSNEQKFLGEFQIIGPNLYSTTNDISVQRSKKNYLNDTTYINHSWIYATEYRHHDTMNKIVRFANQLKLPLSLENYSSPANFNYPKNVVFEKWNGITNLNSQPEFTTFWFMSRFSEESSSSLNEEYFLNYQYEKIPDFLNSNKNQVCIGNERIANGLEKGNNSTLHEMILLEKFGFKTRDIVLMATYNAGRMAGIKPLPELSKLKPTNYNYINLNFGELKKGYRADMVLLKNNPLESIKNYGEISAVIVNGVYLSNMDLEEINAVLKKLDNYGF